MAGARDRSLVASVVHRCSAGLSRSSVAPGVCLSLAVAVWAQQLEVLDAVVEPIAVDGVQLHRDRLATSFGQAAALTRAILEAQPDQPQFEVTSAVPTVGREDLSEWLETGLRRDHASLHGALPRPGAEAKGLRAVTDTMALVVIRLHEPPVEAPAEPFINVLAGSSRVVGHSWLADPEPASDLRARESVCQQRSDQLPCLGSGTGWPATPRTSGGVISR